MTIEHRLNETRTDSLTLVVVPGHRIIIFRGAAQVIVLGYVLV